MSAQPIISIKSTVASIAISAPGTPEHQAIAAKSQVQPLLDQLGPMAQYMHALQNIGSKTITSMTVVYEITDATHTFNQSTTYQRMNFQPGAIKFVAPPSFQHLASAINGKSAGALSTMLLRQKGPTTLPGSALMSVDYVAYADGTRDGPDSAQLGDRLSQRDQQLSVFFQALLSRARGPVSDADLVTWLSSFHHQQVAVGQPPDVADSSVESKAHMAISVMQQQGRSGLITWAQARAK